MVNEVGVRRRTWAVRVTCCHVGQITSVSRWKLTENGGRCFWLWYSGWATCRQLQQLGGRSSLTIDATQQSLANRAWPCPTKIDGDEEELKVGHTVCIQQCFCKSLRRYRPRIQNLSNSYTGSCRTACLRSVSCINY